MAEQEYPIGALAIDTAAANDELPGVTADIPSLLSEARLEARYTDTSLLAANDSEFTETSALSTYPTDAFFRACQRHLEFGPSDQAAQDQQSDLVQDAQAAEAAASSVPKTPKARPTGSKGPSYAL